MCGSCSESTAPLAYLNYTEARVCDKCYDLLLKGGLPFFGVRNYIFDEIRNLLCLSLNKHYKYTIEANPRRIFFLVNSSMLWTQLTMVPTLIFLRHGLKEREIVSTYRHRVSRVSSSCYKLLASTSPAKKEF